MESLRDRLMVLAQDAEIGEVNRETVALVAARMALEDAAQNCELVAGDCKKWPTLPGGRAASEAAATIGYLVGCEYAKGIRTLRDGLADI